MLLKHNPEDEIYQFQAGNFHQDSFYEEVIQELIEEENKEYIQDAIIFLTKFIQSDYSKEEKNRYIKEAADGIYFEGLKVTPLEWLEHTVDLLKKG
ncbi:contact-dependent growth inhibition system immunity protein [Bacillus cereus]|uniref:contact-dependent growth inhibition system immunity protein n=1 Tax=Bacillus cereus TaxID=1396 RepID=UPI0021126A35|nr:contact-dependent growth inhibition system immunity protein [Bacillus cereus]